MIDFKQHQKDIIRYFQEELPALLGQVNLPDFDAYVNDYIDLDLYKKSRQLFFEFGQYNFDELSNMSMTETFSFKVYVALQNGKSSEIQDNMLVYAAAIYKLFEDTNGTLGGLADVGSISTVTFYNAAEGDSSVKVAELDIILQTER